MAPRQKDRVDVLFKRAYGRLAVRHNKRWPDTELLSLQAFKDVVTKPCSYCGHIGSNSVVDHGGRKTQLVSDTVLRINGLDRIDCSKGYAHDNVTPACGFCNAARNTKSRPHFAQWVKQVYDHMKLGGINES